MSAKPKSEDYRLLIEREWADLHHSRVQEWTALGVVTGAHLGIMQLLRLLQEANVELSISVLVILGSFIGLIFSLFGALLTCRHRNLMRIKLGWIYMAEEQLGLIKTAENPDGIIPEYAKMKAPVQWKGIALPRAFSTSWLILCFYILLMFIDIFSIVVFGLR